MCVFTGPLLSTSPSPCSVQAEQDNSFFHTQVTPFCVSRSQRKKPRTIKPNGLSIKATVLQKQSSGVTHCSPLIWHCGCCFHVR